MKTIVTTFAVLLLSISVFSQATLTFERHALRPGDVQVMHRATFVEPGPGGAGLIWNFSDLEFTGEERNHILDATTVEKFGLFPSATVAINTGTDFHSMFRVTPAGNVNVGHFGENFHVIFTQPQRRMMYPFSFGNFHSSTFSGYGVYQNNATTDIVGDYSFEADAWGTLILPNNILTNVLRVRHTLSRYEFALCFASETHQRRYLFYTEYQRYPVLSIIETMFINNNRDTTWHRTAAVNEFVRTTPQDERPPVADRPMLTERREYIHHVFPNPFNDELNVSFVLDEQTTVSVEFYTLEGMRLRTIVPRRVMEQGSYEFVHNTSDLPSGVYFVKFIFNDFAFVKQAIKIR